MERNFLAALGIVENFRARKRLHDVLLGAGALDWIIPQICAADGFE